MFRTVRLNLVGGFLTAGVPGRVGKPQQVFDLTDNDSYRNSGGEARGNGVGDKADKRSELKYAHKDENDARNNSGGK